MPVVQMTMPLLHSPAATADGYYYSKSVRLLKYLLEHPEELEKPLSEEVQYE